jgi:hypothetical protein
MFDLIDYLAMFTSSFVVVFLLGLQSKHVHKSKYFAAAMTSVGISIAQFVFVKYAVNGNILVLIVSAIGGAIGIALSIYVHDHHIEKLYQKNMRTHRIDSFLTASNFDKKEWRNSLNLKQSKTNND